MAEEYRHPRGALCRFHLHRHVDRCRSATIVSTMSDLPKYQRISRIEEGSAWEKKQPSSAGLKEGATAPPVGGKRIQLCFRPRYPCVGVGENVQTKIGSTMEVGKFYSR